MTGFNRSPSTLTESSGTRTRTELDFDKPGRQHILSIKIFTSEASFSVCWDRAQVKASR